MKRIFSLLGTRSSADAEARRDAPQTRNKTHQNACNRGMILKDSQGHYNCCY